MKWERELKALVDMDLAVVVWGESVVDLKVLRCLKKVPPENSKLNNVPRLSSIAQRALVLATSAFASVSLPPLSSLHTSHSHRAEIAALLMQVHLFLGKGPRYGAHGPK